MCILLRWNCRWRSRQYSVHIWRSRFALYRNAFWIEKSPGMFQQDMDTLATTSSISLASSTFNWTSGGKTYIRQYARGELLATYGKWGNVGDETVTHCCKCAWSKSLENMEALSNQFWRAAHSHVSQQTSRENLQSWYTAAGLYRKWRIVIGRFLEKYRPASPPGCKLFAFLIWQSFWCSASFNFCCTDFALLQYHKDEDNVGWSLLP